MDYTIHILIAILFLLFAVGMVLQFQWNNEAEKTLRDIQRRLDEIERIQDDGK